MIPRGPFSCKGHSQCYSHSVGVLFYVLYSVDSVVYVLDLEFVWPMLLYYVAVTVYSQ
jgi:hypothetical protein